jgi:hypothetical protein
MTPEEHAMIMKHSELVKELHDALLAVPAGSPKDAKPLLEEIRMVVRAYNKASWVTRAVIWMLPTLAGLAVAYETIARFMGHGRGQ